MVELPHQIIWLRRTECIVVLIRLVDFPESRRRHDGAAHVFRQVRDLEFLHLLFGLELDFPGFRVELDEAPHQDEAELFGFERVVKLGVSISIPGFHIFFGWIVPRDVVRGEPLARELLGLGQEIIEPKIVPGPRPRPPKPKPRLTDDRIGSFPQHDHAEIRWTDVGRDERFTRPLGHAEPVRDGLLESVHREFIQDPEHHAGAPQLG